MWVWIEWSQRGEGKGDEEEGMGGWDGGRLSNAIKVGGGSQLEKLV